MLSDARAQAAKYYDACPVFPNDIPFYQGRIPSPRARVLELGCGTGRVLLSLLNHCSYIHGIDCSEAMLALCRNKLIEHAVPPSKVRVDLGDITRLSMPMQFDFVIAPFRVLQTLETDEEVDGLFGSVRRHLTPGGSCILNAFNPDYDPESLLRDWVSHEEFLDWEAPHQGGWLTCHIRRPRMDPEKFVLYPELIYRWYEQDVLKETLVHPLAMRCYYPEQVPAPDRKPGLPRDRPVGRLCRRTVWRRAGAGGAVQTGGWQGSRAAEGKLLEW